ncbi:MAG: hypothetical protein FWF54_03255 [Candidatus Azobacteroides sp.]|nr:hypothetical protein [Candidatus Azobacteroides sp.]
MKKEIYKLKDGGIITASSPFEFVTRLREGSKFDSNCTDEEYMLRFAGRYKIQTGNDIRTTGADEFFSDLITYGYIST